MAILKTPHQIEIFHWNLDLLLIITFIDIEISLRFVCGRSWFVLSSSTRNNLLLLPVLSRSIASRPTFPIDLIGGRILASGSLSWHDLVVLIYRGRYSVAYERSRRYSVSYEQSRRYSVSSRSNQQPIYCIFVR